MIPEDAALLKEADDYATGGTWNTTRGMLTIHKLTAALRAALAREAEMRQRDYVDWGSGELMAMNALDQYLPDEGIAKSTSVVYRIGQLGQMLRAAERERDTLAAQGKPRTP